MFAPYKAGGGLCAFLSIHGRRNNATGIPGTFTAGK
jgi:hypothetical protein